jgi:hypothetical protein
VIFVNYSEWVSYPTQVIKLIESVVRMVFTTTMKPVIPFAMTRERYV